ASAADIKYWSLTSMTSAETVADATTIVGGAAVGVNLNTSGMTATLSGATSAAAVFVQENATLKLTNGSRLTVGGGTGPLYIADGKTLTIDASELTLSASNPQAFIAAKVFGTSQIIVDNLSDPDGRIEQSVTEDGVYLTYVLKTASFAMGVDDGLTGTYVTLEEQLAFDGITLQQFHDGGYTLRGRFAGGSINNRGVLVTGYNPVVTDDGNGNVTSIRYEMQGLNNQIKCVIVTLTPNAGNTGINVSATPVSVEGGTSAALYVETGTVGNAFLSGDAAVSGVRKGTFGTSYGQNGCYCLYYLHIVEKYHHQAVAIDGNRSLTVGTDLATAYDKLTLSGTGVATLAGSHLTANRLALEGGVTLDTASMGAIGGLTEISVGSGCKVILHPGADLQATLSGAGTVEFASGSTRIASSNSGLTGGITVKNGVKLTPSSQYAFGPESNDTWVTVESGGVVDFKGQAVHASFRIAGDGAGDGAIVNTGDNIGNNAAQSRSIELTADASIGGTGNLGMMASSYNAVKFKFPAGGATLTKKGSNQFLICNASRDTFGGNGTIRVESGTLYSRYTASTLSGITVVFAGGTLAGDKNITIDTVNIESGTPCNSFGQALTISTLNVNGGNFGRNTTTTVTTMNVGSGGTGVYNAYNKPTTMTVAEGGELNFQNYGNSVFDLSSATISGAGTVKLVAGAVAFADATLAGFSGNLVMAGGAASLDTAGFTGKGGVTATGTAAITATGATMPLDLRDVASGATLTLTGAQVDVGTNRPQGAIVMAGGDGLGTPIMVLKDFCDKEHNPQDNAAYAGYFYGWQMFLSSSANDLS
ncbi:MAG: hypothetical protein IKO43_02205, partial [Kiritimatiellae bacterium]|nr:hypothetical protein [Kiritimatiellia bacterium]